VLGICGGLQMLGEQVHDPLGLEGGGSSAGLGLLAFETRLEEQKQLRNVRGRLALENAEVSGYEIHAGVTTGPALENAAVRWMTAAATVRRVRRADFRHLSARSVRIPGSVQRLLRWAGLQAVQDVDYHGLRERDIERLADLVETASGYRAAARLVRGRAMHAN
jgi:adenosylcobyric acid synthase